MVKKNKALRPFAGQKVNLLEIFKGREGSYMGFGVNHDSKEFRGTLDLKRIINGRGIEIKYKAVGVEGTEFNTSTHLYNEETVLYNEENTIIAYDGENQLCLWTLNSNIPSMVKFELRRYRQISSKKHLFIFGFGNPEDNTIFREEISIELAEDEFTYNYSWGQANGMFIASFSVTMKKIS
jgi:hypothetical protein